MIIESIKIMSHLSTQINLLLHSSQKTYKNREFIDHFIQLEGWYSTQKYSGVLLAVNLNYVIVFANAYLDEFNGYFTPTNYPEHADTILSYRKTVEPALNRIKKWSHLKNLRNEILVHNYRVKGISIFSNLHEKKVYNAPHKDQDIFLLGELILLINKQLIDYFPSEVNTVLSDQEKLKDRYEMKESNVNFRDEIERLTQEVEERKGLSFR